MKGGIFMPEKENMAKRPLNVGLLAHVDAGKTTLSEALMYVSGWRRTLGRVDHRDSLLDTHALERERGITIFSKQARLETPHRAITLVDTPGHVDFSAEAERTMPVLDCAVLVVSGTDGIQAHTLTLWRLLERYGVPTFLFLNKMDLPGSDREKLLEQLRTQFGSGVVDFTAPEAEILENAALCDEALLETYLETGTVTRGNLRSLVGARKLFPLCFGSALKLEGVETLLALVDELAPAAEYGSDFAARVYKISRDETGARLTWLKVTGGSMRVRQPLVLTDAQGKQTEEKVQQLRLYSGDKFAAPEEIPAPDDTSEKGRSFMDRIPDVDDGMEESYDSRLTEPEIGSEIIPDESAMDSHGMLEHGEEEPPFDPSILDDPDLQELPEEPSEPEPPKDEIAEQEYRDNDGSFDAAADAPAPELKTPARQRPVKKGRPKKTRGEGLLGIPHILVTIVWLALIVVIGVTMGRMIWVCAADVLAFGRENKPVTVTVYESDTMDSITDKLYDAGLIRYKSLFHFYADISHAEKKIDPGIYDLNTRYDYHALVNMMSASSTREVVEDLLIPEGYTCRQIFALLEENRICTAQDLSAYAANGALKDYWFLENVTRGDKYCLEGFLFPDTYDFYKNSSPREVLEKMLDNFDYRFSEEMRAQIDTLNATVTDGSFTVREVTIVASLIEKETASASESPRIAGVIYNRLFHWDYPALLNIDAAIIYAQDGVSDHIDTSLDSPYNTYLHVGLTPTPIANPGLASLQAALNPESHNYYYYVLNPATGAHQFSTTQEEHEQYRAQFAAAAAAASTQSEGE